MNKTYSYKQYPFVEPEELRTGRPSRHPVVVIGAGPTGLTAALALARDGVRVVLLTAGKQVSEGSRAICFAKRSLEVFDRLGAVAPMRAKGVTWNTGKLYFRDAEVFSFDLLPEEGHAHPAFINLQQYYVEQYLVAALEEQPAAELRWQHRVADVRPQDDHVQLTVETPGGTYETAAEYVVAADGAGSAARRALGLDWGGVDFEEKFLIADVVMQADFPPERWFWFAPPFGGGHSALLHRQPDNVWRLDFQLGREVDPEEEKKPARVLPRIRAMLGPDVDFELEWVSVYSFQSRRLENFIHGRVIFAGDAAHLMSVFGARGANSGIQDAENLAWKLQLVLAGRAPAALLDSYTEERLHAARENLLYTASSTKFISPAGPGELALRNAVLELAQDFAFARPLINSGRLSTATVVAHSSLNTPDAESFDTPLAPGAPCADARVRIGIEEDYFLAHIGDNFTLVMFFDSRQEIKLPDLDDVAGIPLKKVAVVLHETGPEAAGIDTVIRDANGYLRERYDARPGTCYLVRPDQVICARWRAPDPEKIAAAVRRACGWS